MRLLFKLRSIYGINENGYYCIKWEIIIFGLCLHWAVCNNNLIRRSDVTLSNLHQQYFVLWFFSVPRTLLFIVNCIVIALKVSRLSKVIGEPILKSTKNEIVHLRWKGNLICVFVLSFYRKKRQSAKKLK